MRPQSPNLLTSSFLLFLLVLFLPILRPLSPPGPLPTADNSWMDSMPLELALTNKSLSGFLFVAAAAVSACPLLVPPVSVCASVAQYFPVYICALKSEPRRS